MHTLPEEPFGGNVFRRAEQRAGGLAVERKLTRKAKINQFHVSVSTDAQIVRLDITVYNAPRMQLLEGQRCAAAVETCCHGSQLPLTVYK